MDGNKKLLDWIFKVSAYLNSILAQVSLSAVGEGGPYQLEKN